MPLTDFVAGWMGGITVLLVGHPFDTVKVFQQSSGCSSGPKPHISNSFIAAMEMYRMEGINAFYKGVCAPMCAVGFAKGAMFGTYSYIINSLVMRDTPNLFLHDSDGDGPFLLAFPTNPSEAETQKRDLSEHFRTGGGLSPFENFIASTGGGIAHATIMNPFEVVKIRRQTELLFPHRRYLGTLHCARQLYASGGVKAFFKGYTATLIRDIPGTGVYLASYSALIQCIGGEHNYSIPRILIAGGCAGMAQWALIFPLDTIKTQIQVSKVGEPTDWARCARRLYRHRGWMGLYRGILPALVRAFASNGAAFVGVEATLEFFRNDEMEEMDVWPS